MRILTGIQPSGQVHIGNYFGAIKPMIDFINQDKHEVFCFIADYHALTTVQNAVILKQNVEEVFLDWLACGLDPNKVIFYVQSDLPEVQELAWILHSVCPMGLLERSTAYRDKVEKGISPNSALFNYPVLMAADILIMQADIVPVGKDQKQHIEITRDIATKFNHTFGEVFKLPQEQISENTAIIPGIDGQKMSKSYHNTIPLFADAPTIKKQVMAIVTDSKGVNEPKDPDSCNIFALYKLVANKIAIEEMAYKYKQGTIGYGDAKKELLLAINNYFAKIQQKRQELKTDHHALLQIRNQGAIKAKEIANKTLQIVRKKVGL